MDSWKKGAGRDARSRARRRSPSERSPSNYGSSTPATRWWEPTVPAASFPMCFTPAAIAELRRTVGSRPPESGAKGFARADKFGFDVVEFDYRGSGVTSGDVYSPDTHWGDKRCEHWLNQPEGRQRLWTGDMHSHPGGFRRPSPGIGRGLGDLGYVAEVFAQNPWMEYFLLPILTDTDPGSECNITPWVIHRAEPNRPLLAELRICSVDEFPERIFNPDWEREQASASKMPDADAPGPPVFLATLETECLTVVPELAAGLLTEALLTQLAHRFRDGGMNLAGSLRQWGKRRRSWHQWKY